MRIAGLFAGIGGFELGMHRAGHSTDLVCDVLPAAKAVLAARFPDVEYRDDITLLRSLPASIDAICAGFPCQDLSQAGRTAGLDGERSGLIGEVFRLLSRRRIPTVIVENVPFMLQLNGGKTRCRSTKASRCAAALAAFSKCAHANIGAVSEAPGHLRDGKRRNAIRIALVQRGQVHEQTARHLVPGQADEERGFRRRRVGWLERWVSAASATTPLPASPFEARLWATENTTPLGVGLWT